jgi:chromosome segregation ATPase
MSNNRRYVEIAEYVSIAGSVLGSAIALVSQQAIYGLAPVCVSLSLNLINRRRLEQQCQQFRSTINSLSIANAKVKQDVQNLVPTEELASIVSIVEGLNQQQKGLRLSLVPLQSRLDDLIQQFNHRPELEQIENLVVVIAALKQCIDGLPQPEHLQLQSAELQKQVDRALAQLSEKTTELSKNLEKVEELEQAIAQVQQQLINLQ